MTELAKCSEDLQRLVIAVILLLVFLKIWKNFSCVDVDDCVCTCERRCQEKVLNPLEVQVVVSWLMWVLGNYLGSSREQQTLLTTEPSLRYQHSVFKWNMLQNLRYKMGEMSHDLVKEMVSPNPWNPKLFLSSSWSAPESWAEIGVLSNLNILCSQICGVLGEGRRGQEWEHMYILMAVREYMKVRGQCQYECMEVRGQCQYECLEVRGQYLSSLSTLFFEMKSSWTWSS